VPRAPAASPSASAAIPKAAAGGGAKEVASYSAAMAARKAASENELAESRQKEIGRLRAELEERRDEAAKLRAALSTAEAENHRVILLLKAQAEKATRRGGKNEGADVAAMQAELSKASAEKEAAYREASDMKRQLRSAQDQCDSLQGEVDRLRSQLSRASEPRAAGRPPADGEFEELSALLVEAKMASAQYAYERDELKQQCKKLKAEIERVTGGSKKVAQQLTSIEVKYEELRLKYDTDMRGFIDLKLEAAEARARIDDLEEQLAAR